MPMETSSSAPRHRRPGRTLLSLVLVIVLALFAIAGIIGGIYAWQVASAFRQAESLSQADAFPHSDTRPAPAERPAGSDHAPVNFLLLGADDESDGIPDGADIRGKRSDTIILVNIPADRQSVNAISIMRDNWVDVPGYGSAKINAAMSYGGTPLAVHTVENLLDVRIDHVVLIDFNGLRGLTDAVGGVSVDNPSAFYSHSAGTTIPAGEVTLNGGEALDFVRNRSFRDGDYARVENQQAFLMALAQKLLSADTLTSPSRIQNAVANISPYITVDEGFNVSTAVSLGLSLRNLRTDSINMFTSPTTGLGTEGEQSVVYPDLEALSQISQYLRNDTLSRYQPPTDTEPPIP